MAKIKNSVRSKENEYLGEPTKYDPDFHGPLKNRSCTDIICLLLFLVFLCIWASLGFYAISYGDPTNLLVPKDSYGQRCGKDYEVKEKPYLFFHDLSKCLDPLTPFKGCDTEQVCVSKCPTEFYSRDANEGKLDREYCNNKTEVCPRWYLPSYSFLNRCLYNVADRKKLKNMEISRIQVDEISIMKNLLRPIHLWISLVVHNCIASFTNNDNAHEVGQNIVEDIILSWWKILIGAVLALFVCIIYILILRWVAAPVIWFSIFGVLIALAAGLYFATTQYISTRNNYNSATFQKEKDHYKTRRDLWLAGIIIVSAILAVILLMIIFLRKRIYLAIALVKEGSKAVSSVTASLFFPIFPWILQIGVISYAIVVALFLTSTGNPIYRTIITEACATVLQITNGSECIPEEFANTTKIHTECDDATCSFDIMQNNKIYPYLQVFNVFAFFWLAFFISALGQMVLAGIFAQWYWTWNKRRLPFFAVTSALYRTLRYHIGTLAFGSLIIAICRMIRVMLEYLNKKLKKYDNELTRAVMCVLKCFFYCLEKFLKFINKNAYIMCAIYGKNFCTSAKDAFMLLMRNILRVFVLDKVTDFLFFLSKLLLTLGVGAVAYVLFATDITKLVDNSGLKYGIIPVIIIMICAYLIASVFFSVYSIAVDTLFLCFLEDCERNDGSSQKPYYMSKNLMKIFGKRNKLE